MDTLLFDLDGTLTDNRPGIIACLRHALARVGAESVADDDALRAFLGPPLRESFARLLATNDTTRIERALANYRERFDDIGWRENVVYPGIAKLLPALVSRGHRMIVCTTKPAVYARRIVAHFGLTDAFAQVYGPGLDGALDDKRELLAHLIRSENLDPAHARMIGDRHYDVRAARANATAAVGVLWGYGSREELGDADCLVETPAELEEALAASSA